MKKPSEVLVIGTTSEKWLRMRDAIAEKATFASSIEEAVEMLQRPEGREFRVILLSTEIGPANLVLIGCERLAEHIAKHPKQPWVTWSDSNVDHLAAIFERHGIVVVEDCDISFVLTARSGRSA